MIKKILKFISVSFLFFVIFYPIIVSAFVSTLPPTPCTAMTGLDGILCKISGLLGTVLPILVAFGVVYFVWGVITYVIANEEEAKKNGRSRIIYGIIGLTVIVSIWGLVYILSDTLGLTQEAAPATIGTLVPGGANQGSCSLSNNPKFADLLNYVTCIIGSSVIPLFFALAIVMFVWGAIKFFIIDATEEAKKSQGKQFMIWGIIALTVMISIWGLVKILGATFNIDTTFVPQVRQN